MMLRGGPRAAVAVLLLLVAVATIASSTAAATPTATTTTMTTPSDAVRALPAAPLPASLAAKHAAAKKRTLSLLLKKRDGGGGGGGGDDCDIPGYRNRVMGLLHEANFLGLFADLKGETKLEASGMDVVGADLWVVFDNTPSVGLLDLHFGYEDPHNVLIPPVVGAKEAAEGQAEKQEEKRQQPAAPLRAPAPKKRGRRGLLGQSDSQFEGISAIPSRPGEFMIIEEMREVEGAGNGSGDDEPLLFHPFAQRVALSRKSPRGYRVLERCAVHLALTRENKGVEGIEYVEDTRGKGWLLAACEGNWCAGGRKGRDRGHGKMAALEFVPASGGEPCSWRVAKTLDIPPAAAFLDYSDLAFADPGFRGEPVAEGKGAVAVLSQEDAALWVGEFDYDKMEFSPDVPGAVFLLPKDGSCRTIWCNAEGLAWLDATRLAVATDRAKSSQPHECTSKDEALATFALPDGADAMIRGGDNEDEDKEGRDQARVEEGGKDAARILEML